MTLRIVCIHTVLSYIIKETAESLQKNLDWWVSTRTVHPSIHGIHPCPSMQFWQIIYPWLSATLSTGDITPSTTHHHIPNHHKQTCFFVYLMCTTHNRVHDAINWGHVVRRRQRHFRFLGRNNHSSAMCSGRVDAYHTYESSCRRAAAGKSSCCCRCCRCRCCCCTHPQQPTRVVFSKSYPPADGVPLLTAKKSRTNSK